MNHYHLNKNNLLIVIISITALSAFFILYNKISQPNTIYNEGKIDFSLLMKKTESEKITGHKIQVEIQNGCGFRGIAKLYTNFLRNNGYDVIDYKNAPNFDYQKTHLIIHKQDTSNFVNEIINILQISPELVSYNYDDDIIYEMTVIIGRDYNILDSYSEVSMHYEPF
jgi:hypothetical protein